MASKKSKILAIAFCAAVMAGIHVNPVLAAEIPVSNGSVTVRYKDFETTTGTGVVEEAQVTITNIASQDDLAQETADREKADAAHDKAIGDLELENDKQDSAIAGLDAQLKEEADARQEADAAHDQAIGDLELENDKQDSAIAGLDAQLKEEADARQEADADLQDQIDGHTNQIESMGDQLDDLKANDEKQDATLEGHTNQIDSMGDQLDDLKANDEAQDGRLQGVENKNVEQDNRLQGVENKNVEQDNRLQGVENKNVEQDNRLQGVENKNVEQDNRLQGVENKNVEQDNRLQGVENKNVEQDNRLQGVENKNVEQDNRLDNHEDVMGVANSGELQDRYADTNYISGAADMAEADVILDREISRVDGRVDRLENRVDGLEDRIDKVGAMAAAIANLRTMGYDPAAPTEVAVGVGQYRDETGMALGLFHYPNRDFMLSLSVSTSGDEYMGGIGATWKFGRKSPEKVAEIKKAQAEADARRAEEQKLAKAEEMKKAAKEAKVQAQMERHAKLAAERAALEEA